jgi:two-component system sensor histidine kinase ChvG
MTSLVPLQTRWGCWILISSHTTCRVSLHLGRPAAVENARKQGRRPVLCPPRRCSRCWWWSASRAACAISGGSPPISARAGPGICPSPRRNVAPELGSVAADFDALATDLQNVARDIRQSAEDNAHSFKAPVATVEASLEMVRRNLQSDDGHARNRALELISGSVDRLKALISAAQQLDNVTADLIEAPRHRVNLGEVVGEVAGRFHDVVSERKIRSSRRWMPRFSSSAANRYWMSRSKISSTMRSAFRRRKQ